MRLETPLVSIVIPTFNERSNVEHLIDSIRTTMQALAWEIIVVDDDSPDRTWEEVGRLSRGEPRVRCIRRIGRRGLSSAVIEGVLASNGEVVAVMDADFQHDEKILPLMYQQIVCDGADLVVGTRYAAGGAVSDWDQSRRSMSSFATWMSQMLIGRRTSDPMSGFFMARRSIVAEAVYDLSQQGYKILLDIISSAPPTIKIAEQPYTFRSRREGDSKLSTIVLLEYAFLLLDKLSRGAIPPRFLLFCFVGGLGVSAHLSLLFLAKHLGLSFLEAQTVALYGAMVFNYFLNNRLTYYDRRLRGGRMYVGLLLFCLICSIGGIANIGVADVIIHHVHRWSLAGLAGAMMGAVFNFGAASSLVWGRRRRQVHRTRPGEAQGLPA